MRRVGGCGVGIWFGGGRLCVLLVGVGVRGRSVAIGDAERVVDG